MGSNPNKAKVDSRYESFKNSGSDTFTTTITGATLPASNAVYRTFTFPLQNTTDPLDIKLNFSFYPTLWYQMRSTFTFWTPGVFMITPSLTFSSNTATLSMLIANSNAGGATIADFTVNVNVLRYKAPW